MNADSPRNLLICGAEIDKKLQKKKKNSENLKFLCSSNGDIKKSCRDLLLR
jgi:hypothetical protein